MIFETDIRKESLLQAARQMMTAARTAPKARGMDNIAAGIAEAEDILRLSEKMLEISERAEGLEYMSRDAKNILSCEVLVLIGTRISPLRLPNCGLCGMKDCAEKDLNPSHPCYFNAVDLGIAVGSAVSAARDLCVDNRVMNSVGVAARELKLLGGDIALIFGIPLSCTGKSPFFDRKFSK